MKVICIDSKPYPFITIDNSPSVIEGETYEVTSSWLGKYCGRPFYSLKGFDCVEGTIGFLQKIFIECSSIDETELVKERLTTVNQ